MIRPWGWLLVSVTAFAAALFTFCSATRHPTGPPKLNVDRSSDNWGKVPPSTSVHTTFVLKNEGGQDLRIGDIVTSCGCTKPSLSESILAPGQTTYLKVSFAVPNSLGPVQHFIRIPTNDPVAPLTEVHLFADSWIGVRPAPQSVDFGEVAHGDVVERFVQLHTPDNAPFRITGSRSSSTEVICDSDDADALLPIHRVRLVFKPSKVIGHCYSSVQVLTTRPDARIVDIPIVSHTSGTVSVSPSTIEIARTDIGNLVTRHIVVHTRTTAGDSALIKSIIAQLPWELIHYEIHPLSSNAVALKLTLRFPNDSGASSGALTIAIDVDGGVSCRIPLVITGWTPPLPEGQQSSTPPAGLVLERRRS